MKFSKALQQHVHQYYTNDFIPIEYWFQYKKYKKILNTIKKHNLELYRDFGDGTECCICLETNVPMMQTFCCHNLIHHKCFIQSILSTSTACPLCRTDVVQFFRQQPKTNEECVNYNVLALISNIYLDIIKIEDVCNNMLIVSEKIRQHYIQLNYTALTKICKKIKKYTSIDLKDYFIDIINKHNILPKHMSTSKSQTLFQRLLHCFVAT